jgi:hypothetical protein
VRRLLVLLVIAASFSCGKNPAQPGADPILVLGGDMGPFFENLSLSRSGVALTGAQVKVNDTTIPEISAGLYRGQLPTLLSVGAQVKVEVRAGNDVVTGIAKIPVVPIITTPVAGDAVHPGTALAYRWTDTLNPDEFTIWLQYSGTGQTLTATGSARSASVETNAIPATATSLTADVFAYANGTFTGPADPASKMRVRQPAVTVPLVLVF